LFSNRIGPFGFQKLGAAMPASNPRGVGKFLLGLFGGLIVVFVIIVLLIYFHGHKPKLMKSPSSQRISILLQDSQPNA
jgi:hypothetical protein